MERLSFVPIVENVQRLGSRDASFTIMGRQGSLLLGGACSSNIVAMINFNIERQLSDHAMAKWARRIILLNALKASKMDSGLWYDFKRSSLVSLLPLPSDGESKDWSLELIAHVEWMRFLEVQIYENVEESRRPQKRPAASPSIYFNLRV